MSCDLGASLRNLRHEADLSRKLEPKTRACAGCNGYEFKLTHYPTVGGSRRPTAGIWRLDGISEPWFDNASAMRAATPSDAYRAVAAGEPSCMVGTKVIVAEQNVVVPVAADAGPLVKRMSILTRQPDVTAERFRDE